MTCNEAAPLLNAYLDGELDAVNCTGVEQHMIACAVCARRYDALLTVHDEIDAADLAYEPPAALVRKVKAAAPSRRTWIAPLAIVAAAAVLVFAVYVPLHRPTPALESELLDDHLRSLSAHLVDVPSSDHHTVKPWFQGRTGLSPVAPNLEANGFVLAGGRLEALRGERVPAIVYRRGQHVINLFEIPTQAPDAAIAASAVNGYNVLHWTHNGIAYWAVSDLNAAELRTFAALVQAAH